MCRCSRSRASPQGPTSKRALFAWRARAPCWSPHFFSIILCCVRCFFRFLTTSTGIFKSAGTRCLRVASLVEPSLFRDRRHGLKPTSCTSLLRRCALGREGNQQAMNLQMDCASFEQRGIRSAAQNCFRTIVMPRKKSGEKGDPNVRDRCSR